MFVRPVLVFLCFSSLIFLGSATECYHCYDSYKNITSFGGDISFGEKLVRCDKNINKWNTWKCPAKWPICIIMAGKVEEHYERIRTCAVNDFCSQYKPPVGVKLEYCQECNTTLCNAYPKVPDPPYNPGPQFNFNININLNLKKYPLYEDNEEN